MYGNCAPQVRYIFELLLQSLDYFVMQG